MVYVHTGIPFSCKGEWNSQKKKNAVRHDHINLSKSDWEKTNIGLFNFLQCVDPRFYMSILNHIYMKVEVILQKEKNYQGRAEREWRLIGCELYGQSTWYTYRKFFSIRTSIIYKTYTPIYKQHGTKSLDSHVCLLTKSV